MTAPRRATPASILKEVLTPAPWIALRAGWRRCALAAWIAALAVVTIGSLLPALGPSSEHGLDKMVHALGYLILALLPFAAFENRRNAVAAALFSIPFGFAIELAQGFVPGRSGDVWDAAADAAGALAGIALGARFRRIVGAVTRGTSNAEQRAAR